MSEPVTEAKSASMIELTLASVGNAHTVMKDVLRTANEFKTRMSGPSAPDLTVEDQDHTEGALSTITARVGEISDGLQQIQQLLKVY